MYKVQESPHLVVVGLNGWVIQTWGFQIGVKLKVNDDLYMYVMLNYVTCITLHT